MELKHKINFGILVVIIVIGFFAYFSFIGQFNEFQITPSTRKGGFVSQLDPSYPEELDMHVFLKTTSLSAQHPIDVEVKVMPSEHFYKYPSNLWDRYTENFYVLFPDALKYPLHQYAEGNFEGAIIELNKNENPRTFTGNGKIIFQQGGEYGWALVSQDFIDKHNIEFKTTSITLNEITPKISNLTLFTIGDPNVTTEQKTNNLILTITLLAFGASIVQSRNHIIDGITWIDKKIVEKHRLVVCLITLSFGILLIIFLIYYLDEITIKDDGQYGFKFVSKTHDFEITRENTNWFFFWDVDKKIKELGYQVPIIDSMKNNLLIQKYSGEIVFVGVYSKPVQNGSSYASGEMISNMFNYYGETEFTYTLKEINENELYISGKHEDSKSEINARFIIDNENLYVIESINKYSSSKVSKAESDSILDSFQLCSNQVFSCLK
ncbi:MAG: hypothetical protein K5793_02740 [Nitrosarchaeum sp.]|nr:hypothetical protein [Nitrosarchaeum sp.]